MDLKRIILKEVDLLIEKRIAQLSANIEIVLSFDIIKHSGHVDKRMSGRDDVDGYDNRPVTNSEIKYFIELFKSEIAENIVFNRIIDGEPFIIKSSKLGLAIPLKPVNVGENYWRLIVLTVWRESEINKLKVGKNQLVLSK